MSDIEATYLAVVLTTREFLKELGAHNDQYIVRVRLFAPGTSIANTKEMQDKIFKYGKGHWKPGQYSPAFNRYWWEWTDGE